MRPAETIIEDIEHKLEESEWVNRAIKALIDELKNAPKDEWDWISVKKASLLLDVSVCAVYAKSTAGN